MHTYIHISWGPTFSQAIYHPLMDIVLISLSIRCDLLAHVQPRFCSTEQRLSVLLEATESIAVADGDWKRWWRLYLVGVAVAASVFTISAMSIDRYLAIRSPMAFRRVFNRRSTVLVIVALWLVALIIFAPVLRAVSITSNNNLTMIIIYDIPTMKNDSENFVFIC